VGDDFLGKLPDGTEIAAQAVAALFTGNPVKSAEVAIYIEGPIARTKFWLQKARRSGMIAARGRGHRSGYVPEPSKAGLAVVS